MIRFLILIFILASCGTKEAHFVIRNKDEVVLTDVFIVVNPNDSIPLYRSKPINVRAKSQEEIFFPIPNEPFHQAYEFNYTRQGKTTVDNYTQFTAKVPSDQHFLIEQELDTILIRSFTLN